MSSTEPSHMHCSFLDCGAEWSFGVFLPKDKLWFWPTPGTLWGFHHSEFRWASFDFPFLAFSLPFICLHRLWLWWPFRNGVGGDSVRTNHGFIPVQPQLVSRAFKTELLWECMDTSRGLQQRVDTGTILALLLSHTNHTTTHSSSCTLFEFCCAHPLKKAICACNTIGQNIIFNIASASSSL